PQRMCSACRQMQDKRQLLRIVKSPEGQISLDLTGKKAGRGAYICLDEACLQKVIKSRSLEKALKAKIDEKLYGEIREYINNK
ncbi:MAG: YlxR family protein, partial [Clostridiales bacterium]